LYGQDKTKAPSNHVASAGNGDDVDLIVSPLVDAGREQHAPLARHDQALQAEREHNEHNEKQLQPNAPNAALYALGCEARANRNVRKRSPSELNGASRRADLDQPGLHDRSVAPKSAHVDESRRECFGPYQRPDSANRHGRAGKTKARAKARTEPAGGVQVPPPQDGANYSTGGARSRSDQQEHGP